MLKRKQISERTLQMVRDGKRRWRPAILGSCLVGLSSYISPVSSAVAAAGTTYQGTVNIPTSGTYYIPLAQQCTVGVLSSYIGEIPNGVWAASADIVMAVDGHRRPLVANINQWQYAGNEIQANLQPDQGANTQNYITSPLANLAQVVVGYIGQGSTLYWTLTCYQ